MKIDKLPESWEAIRFGDIAYIKNGYAFPSTDFKTSGTVPLIKQSQLAGNAVCLDKCAYLDEKYLKSHRDFVLQQGDVLIGMSGSIGKLCIYDLDIPALQNQRTGKIVARNLEVIDKEIFWFYLQTIENQLKKKGKGIGVANVSGGDIESLPFALPPLAEQRRIVAQLKATMQKLEASQERLDKLPDLLKKFRQAVLAAAVSGKLTEAWRAEQSQGETGADLLDRIRTERRTQWEEKYQAKLSGKQLSLDNSWKSKYEEPAAPDTSELPELPEGWEWATVHSLGNVTGGLTKNQNRANAKLKMPYLRVANVYANELRLEEIEEIGVEESELSRTLLQKNDLLIVEGNGSPDQIGRVARWDDSIPKCLHQNHLIKVRLYEDEQSEYLLYWLLSLQGREHIRKVAVSSSGLYTLSISKIGGLPVPVPPLHEQQEIVRQVNHYFELATQLEARFEQAAALVEQLPQALLAKAFSGQLVPQDPDDEPAGALLERLHTEPAASMKGKRGRKAKVAGEAPLFE